MKNITIIAIVSLLALLFAACDGGPAPAALTFEGSDLFQYSPSSATVTTGAEVTVTFNNVGVLEHNWLLIPNNVDPIQATEADGFPGANSGIIAAGDSRTFTFAAPAAGTYQFVCTVPGHAIGGMIGTLTVTD
jgi:uncharacterized cupredoxin-like copper-binding protein